MPTTGGHYCCGSRINIYLYLMPDCLSTWYRPTTTSSRYNAAPIQHTYTHVHSPAVSDCSVSAQGLVHFSPKPSVLAPSLRLHAACLRPCRANGNSSLQAVQLINCPASGAQIGLVPFAQLVLSGRSRSQLSASRWSQLPSLSLIRTFYKPGPLPARHLALGEPPSCWSPNFLTLCYSPFTTPEKACPSIEWVEPEICNIPRHCDTGIASSSRAALTHRVLAGAVTFLLCSITPIIQPSSRLGDCQLVIVLSEAGPGLSHHSHHTIFIVPTAPSCSSPLLLSSPFVQPGSTRDVFLSSPAENLIPQIRLLSGCP